MSEVTLKINKRGYSMSCDVGQEERLVELGHYVDERLSDIAAAGAASNESHLLVLTSLVLADEVFELREEMSRMDTYIRDLRNGRVSVEAERSGSSVKMSDQEEKLIVDAIEHLADKIEAISSKLQKPLKNQAA